MKKNILIIDDEEVMLFLHEKVIRNVFPQAEVFAAGSAREAFEYLEESRDGGRSFPSLIFIDGHMPVVNGFQFLEKFRTDFGSHRPNIYMVSSSTDPRDRTRAQVLEITDYIIKPLTVEKLQEALIEHLKVSPT